MAKPEIAPPSMEVRMSLEHLGRQIAEARKERGMTQRALADMLGVGTQLVAHIEQGRETVQIGHYARAAWIFELRGLPLITYLMPDPAGD